MGAALASSSATPGFRLTLTTYADPAAMHDWVLRAQPGHEMIYASGPAIGDHPAKRAARDLADRGLVELFQRRGARPHSFDYCARKIGQASMPVAPQPDHTRAQLSGLLRLLRRCAERHTPCPSNTELARELALPIGERGRRRARYLLQRLESERRIAVTGCGRNAPRVVTILAAGRARGKSTAGDQE